MSLDNYPLFASLCTTTDGKRGFRAVDNQPSWPDRGLALLTTDPRRAAREKPRLRALYLLVFVSQLGSAAMDFLLQAVRRSQ
ncbi:hypothetical protein [Streptomyces sp. SolWspMP-sol7th]|uniref:hypothetical protein n=1 Tax=Streptomyces sp. SolWspMP-sol7th TaxID=1839776 RepID=UPI0015863BEA|nr:hypothetical protein [Streptomyces sp. SolWspMP-sol7th]